MNEKNIGLLVLTQENYLEELKIIIHRLNELEINQHFKCYIASKGIKNDKKFFGNWNSIEIDSNCRTWGMELIYCLNQIQEEYIFLFLDDFYPYKYISASKLKQKLYESLKYKPSLIRINSNYNRRFFIRKIKPNIYVETYQHRYSTSLVLPVFKKDFLTEIVSPEDTPWIFEKNSNSRFKFNKHRFFFIKGSDINFNVANIVVKGKSLRSSINRIPKNKRENYLKMTSINVMSLFEEIYFHLKKFVFDTLIRYLPYY